jgi:hypothetical protein
MEILDLKNDVVSIHPAALQLPCFNSLWLRDKTKTKTKALKELSYIYFIADYKSDFSDIIDEKERKEEVSKLFEIQEDALITECIEFYKERQQTISMHLLQAAKLGVNKIKQYIETVDLTELDDKGKPVHDVSKLNMIIARLGDTIEGIRKLEEIVAKEIEDNTRVRGGNQLGMFENPD